MARTQGTYTRYQAGSLREDLTDLISNISPTETPFYSNCGQGTARTTYHEWNQDSLAAAAQNHQIDGDDLSVYTTLSATSRIGNWTSIMRKDYSVSGTLEVIDKAGRDSELAYQQAKAMKELKRDLETNLTANNAGTAGAEGTAREMGSVVAFIKTNTGKGTNGTDPVYTSAPTNARSDGTTRAASETLMEPVLQAVWTAGGEPSILMVGAHVKGVVSGFSGIATLYKNIPGNMQATIIGAADVYVGDFGEYAIVPNRFSRTRDMLILDTDHLEVDWLRPFRVKPLATTGDATKEMIIGEATLKVKNEAACGILTDLSAVA